VNVGRSAPSPPFRMASDAIPTFFVFSRSFFFFFFVEQSRANAPRASFLCSAPPQDAAFFPLSISTRSPAAPVHAPSFGLSSHLTVSFPFSKVAGCRNILHPQSPCELFPLATRMTLSSSLVSRPFPPTLRSSPNGKTYVFRGISASEIFSF